MTICADCGREYEYDRSKGHRVTKCNSCTATACRLRKKQKCVAYKGGKCQRCGYDKCLRALEFHHRDPEKKSFELSKFITNSWTKLKAELDKCDLLCSNCHQEVEAGQ